MPFSQTNSTTPALSMAAACRGRRSFGIATVIQRA
jgi:hypothetical protein